MNRRAKPSSVPGSAAWKALAALGLAGILITTLYPSPENAKEAALTPLWCLVCGSDGGADVLLNLLLFVPFAVGLRLSGLAWWRVIVISALLSLIVETLQFTVVSGRDASLSDWLTNTLGGAVGAGAAPLVPGALGARPQSARRLMWVWAAVWLSSLVVSAWLMSPWVPGDTVIHSRWAPGWEARQPFGGRVTNAMAAGFSLPNGGVADSVAEVLREDLRRERFDLQVEAISVSPTGESAWVYAIDLGWIWSPILNQRDRTLLFSIPVQADRLGLRAPTIALPKGFPDSAWVPVRINAREGEHHLRITSAYGGVVRTSDAQLSPTQGWVLVAVFGLALGPYGPLVTALYLLAWLLPLGYWAARSGWRASVIGVVAGTVVLGLGLIPSWTGYPPVSWSEWVGAFAGVTAGWALYRPAAYLETRCASPSSSEFSSS